MWSEFEMHSLQSLLPSRVGLHPILPMRRRVASEESSVNECKQDTIHINIHTQFSSYREARHIALLNSCGCLLLVMCGTHTTAGRNTCKDIMTSDRNAHTTTNIREIKTRWDLNVRKERATCDIYK